MNISLITDEVSHDPFTAIELGLRWGIRHYEIRNVYRWRLPMCPPWAADRAAAAVKAYGVTITAISPGIFKPVMQVDGSTTPVGVDQPAEVERHLEVYLPKAFDFAARLGTKNMIVFALPRPAHVAPGDVPAPVLDALARAARKAEAAGVRLLLEINHNTCADCGRSAKVILEAINSPHLQLTWDPSNIVYGKLPEDPVREGYPLIRSHIGNVHVKDAAILDGKPHWVMMGDGVMDWPEQLRLLRADRYDGFLTLEPHLQFESPVNLVAQIEEFVRRVRLLMQP
jgi:sugar phosphate isomerase/epimerase